MNSDKFTQKAQDAVLDAQRLASELNHAQIEPEHLLLALLRQADGVVPQVVGRIGDAGALLGQVEEALAGRPKVYGANAQPGLSRAAGDALTGAGCWPRTGWRPSAGPGRERACRRIPRPSQPVCRISCGRGGFLRG